MGVVVFRGIWGILCIFCIIVFDVDAILVNEGRFWSFILPIERRVFLVGKKGNFAEEAIRHEVRNYVDGV